MSTMTTTTRITHKYLMGKSKHELALMILDGFLADTDRVDWMEANVDDLSVTRDLTAGARFRVAYCARASGCPVAAVGDSLRVAVDLARKDP